MERRAGTAHEQRLARVEAPAGAGADERAAEAALKGRAYQLLSDFKQTLSGASAPFLMSRLILRARVIPDNITPEIDDPAIEKRLDEAIRALTAERNLAP